MSEQRLGLLLHLVGVGYDGEQAGIALAGRRIGLAEQLEGRVVAHAAFSAATWVSAWAKIAASWAPETPYRPSIT
ncbi:MAG: hypothetical protein QOE40_3249 [Actinomycetota bacterium]|nr:hypothetical protein [Actinomycetota bacterium]